MTVCTVKHRKTKKHVMLKGFEKIMDKVTLDYSNAMNFIDVEEILGFKDRVSSYHQRLHSSPESDAGCLGWIDLPKTYCRDEFFHC